LDTKKIFQKFCFGFKIEKIVFSILLIFGVALGSICINKISNASMKEINSLFFLDLNYTSNFNIHNLMYSFGMSSIFIVVMILMSLSVFGIIGIFLLIFLKGFGIGLILGSLYITHSLKGIIFGIIIILPGAFFSSMILIFLASESLKLAIKFSKKLLPNPGETYMWNELVNYTKKAGISVVFIILSSFLDFGLSCLFSKFFNF